MTTVTIPDWALCVAFVLWSVSKFIGWRLTYWQTRLAEAIAERDALIDEVKR